MKFSGVLLILSILLPSASALPQLESRGACTQSPVKISGNPFSGRRLHTDTSYATLVVKAANTVSDPGLKENALKVGKAGMFTWLDTASSISGLDEQLKKAKCDEIVGIVIHNLNTRRCVSQGSRPPPPNDIPSYKANYIDEIVKIIKANPNVAIAAIIEPAMIGDIISNRDLQSCKDTKLEYEEGVSYALKALNQANVAQYIDAAHGGWLGWTDNLTPGANLILSVYAAAGSPSSFRGFSTNVENYNAYILRPGEFSDEPDAAYNGAQDEERFVKLFGAELEKLGVPNHAIVDTSRSGVQGVREEWGEWCNVAGAGLGVRPSVNTNVSNALTDAFVWVNNAGKSDGTSHTADVLYNSFCGKKSAFKPAPLEDEWNQAYFEMLVRNANPPL